MTTSEKHKKTQVMTQNKCSHSVFYFHLFIIILQEDKTFTFFLVFPFFGKEIINNSLNQSQIRKLP